MKLKTGMIIDGYKILAETGTGACGTVYQASNTVSGEIVALKILPGRGNLPERELNALKLYQGLEHPNLIRVRHIGVYEDSFFYTMDWCESSLAQRKVSPDELLKIAEEIADALRMLHTRGLIHRDIKPDNIFFRQGKPVLGDIGLLTNLSTATFAGSPGFLAPALMQGHNPDAYSDCYALAKTIYCALSGQAPTHFPVYEGDLTPSAAKLMQCVLSVCGVEPKIRTAEGILAFLDKKPAKASSVPQRRKWILLLCVIIFILVAAGKVFSLLQQGQEKGTAGKETTELQTPSVPDGNTVAENILQTDAVKREKEGKSDKLFQPELPSDARKKVKNISEINQFFAMFNHGGMTTYTLKEEIAKEFPERSLNREDEAKWEKIYQKWRQDSMIYQKQTLDEFKKTGESVLSIWERRKPEDAISRFFLTYYAEMTSAYRKMNYILLSPDERKPLHEEYRKKLAVFIRERNKLLDQIKN